MNPSPPSVDLLLVDDDAPTRRYFEMAVRGLGHSVRACATPSQALRLLDEGRVRLLVSDLHLGAALADELLAPLAGLPDARRPCLVLMSGGLDPEIEQRYRALGVRHFWAKPVSLDGLRESLRQLLPSPAAAQEQPSAAAAAHAVPDQAGAAQTYFKGNVALYQRFFAQSLPQLRLDLAAATQAWQHGETGVLLGQMHNFKSVLRLLGMPPLGQLSEAIEARLKAGDLAGCEPQWRALSAGIGQLVEHGGLDG